MLQLEATCCNIACCRLCLLHVCCILSVVRVGCAVLHLLASGPSPFRVVLRTQRAAATLGWLVHGTTAAYADPQ